MKAPLASGTSYVIPGITIAGVLALYFISFVRRLPPKTRSGFVIAGTMFVGGGVTVETLGEWNGGLRGIVNLTTTGGGRTVRPTGALDGSSVQTKAWALWRIPVGARS